MNGIYKVLLLVFLQTTVECVPCAKKFYTGSDINLVCVCNETYCDDFEPVDSIRVGTAIIVTSSIDGARFKKWDVSFTNNSTDQLDDTVTVDIDTSEMKQKILGFGGAFTDSAGINIASLSPEVQKHLLNSYFSTNGLEYTIGRVPIASTDFSTREYSYADTPNDFNLSKFALQQDDHIYKLTYIKQAIKLSNGNLKLFASPWSAPAWMKTNGAMKGGGFLKGPDCGPYHISYANYLVKFFEEYAKEGVNFWGMTIQNEPTSGYLPDYKWQTMGFNGLTEASFLAHTLGPALQTSSSTRNLKVMVMDDNRFNLPGFPDMIFGNPNASKFAHGTALHWYGNFVPAEVISIAHKHNPSKFILATEACSGYMGLVRGPILGAWLRGEQYISDMITDLNHWVVGWTDWNIALNEQGGPTWVENWVDSPIIVNASSNEFYKQPMFYAMGHLSKFMRPGAKIVSTEVSPASGIEACAGIINNRRVLVVLNRSDKEVSLRIKEVGVTRELLLPLPRRSIHTIMWNK